MRRDFIGAALFVAAFGSCLWAIRAKAEEAPLAVCKEGKCVMSEADYEAFKKYAEALYRRAEHNDKLETDINETLQAYRNNLERCESERKKWRTKWDS